MAGAALEAVIRQGNELLEPYVPPPSAFLALTEAHRAFAEILTLNLSRRHLASVAPGGDGKRGGPVRRKS